MLQKCKNARERWKISIQHVGRVALPFYVKIHDQFMNQIPGKK